MSRGERFVRVPTLLLEALLRARLTGVEWRIVLWIIRQTYGWNRPATPFSWYRIAIELAMDRGGVVRAGRRLLGLGILYLKGNEIGMQPEDTARLRASASTSVQEAMTDVSDDRRQRKAMTGIIASDDESQRERCLVSSLFRRAKDSSKDNIKKKRKDTADLARQPFGNGALSELRHPAGAARPIPGKYDCFSQNR